MTDYSRLFKLVESRVDTAVQHLSEKLRVMVPDKPEAPPQVLGKEARAESEHRAPEPSKPVIKLNEDTVEKSNPTSAAKVTLTGEGAEIDFDIIERNFYHHLLTEKISSPLTQISGFASAILREPELRNSTREMAQSILDRGREVSQLIDEYTDINAFLSGSLKPESQVVELQTFVSRLHDSFLKQAQANNLNLTAVVEDEAPYSIELDQRRANYILRNLIDNALRNTESGFVELKVSFSDVINCITFTVSDSGSGMTPEQLSSLLQSPSEMELPLTSSSTAPGFGLQFSQRVAEKIGGVLTIQSSPGAGTTAALSFGAEIAVATQDLDSSTTPLEDLEARILFVDDTSDYRKLYESQLASTKLTSAFYTSGEKALSSIKQEEADMVLLNITLPDISAASFARQARQKGVEIPILAISASPSKSLAKATLEAGCNACVSRQKTAEQLLPILADYLKGESKPPTAIPERGGSQLSQAHFRQGVLLLQEKLSTLDHLLDRGEWEEIEELTENFQAIGARLHHERLQFAINKFQDFLGAKDEVATRRSTGNLNAIIEGILIGISTSSEDQESDMILLSEEDFLREPEKFALSNLEKIDLDKLKELEKEVPNLLRWCSEEKWQEISLTLEKYRERLDESGVPTLVEHLLVLEAWATAHARDQLTDGFNEVKEHIAFYRGGA